MIAIWPSRTRVLIGRGALGDALRDATAGGPTVALVDAGADAASGGELARIVAEASSARKTLTLTARGAGSAEIEELAEAIADARIIVAVGGGTVLDLAKLACLAAADGGTIPALRRAARSSLVLAPTTAAVAHQRVLVPTTIGTGSEVSGAACVLDGARKRLVLGEALRPELAVLDPVLTRTLPRRLVAEGVLEALLRVAGPVVARPPHGRATVLAVQDSLALWLLRELAAIGDRVASGAADGEPGDGLRAAAAQLSAYTHVGWALTGRDPFGWKLWYVANELSTTLGVRKMEAVACLLPAYWRRLASSDDRYGSYARLLDAWRAVSDGLDTPADPDPVEGVVELLRRWGVDAPLVADDREIETVARRVVRAWGGGLPMLSPLRLADVRTLLADAIGGGAGRQAVVPGQTGPG